MEENLLLNCAKASNSSYYVPSVRYLPATGISLRLCVLLTHIPRVCMSTLPKVSHLKRVDGKVFHLWSLFTSKTVLPHISATLLIYTHV